MTAKARASRGGAAAVASISFEKDRRLNGKYLEDGEKLLRTGDLLQAGEKFWGVAAEIVKAVAAKEGRHLRTHNQLWSYLLDLDEKHSELGLRRDFVSAGYLHANFYEEELTPRTVRKLADDVRSFVKKMSGFLWRCPTNPLRVR